jgi:pyruvate/2-oxoglutarate dehydrogenase complex dihydrolipoamide acyltransferase (E2) component
MAPKSKAFIPDPLDVEEAPVAKKGTKEAAAPKAAASKAKAAPKEAAAPKAAPKTKAAAPKVKSAAKKPKTAGLPPMSHTIMNYFTKGGTPEGAVAAVAKVHGTCRPGRIVEITRAYLARGWKKVDGKNGAYKMMPPK